MHPPIEHAAPHHRLRPALPLDLRHQETRFVGFPRGRRHRTVDLEERCAEDVLTRRRDAVLRRAVRGDDDRLARVVRDEVEERHEGECV